MLFNSYPYIPFLILTVLGYWGLERYWPGARRPFLLLVSYVFYAWWRADFLLLLVASTLVNFGLGTAITARHALGRDTRFFLYAGLGANLAVLGLFKYAGMAAGTIDALFATHIPIPAFFLPLAISFFTFEQISYLADAASGRAPRYRLLDYALFVGYFPHLIAGPIIRHNDLIPQFNAPARNAAARGDDMAVGATLFTIGLAKKTLIAENLAPFVDVIYAAAHHGAVSTGDAWLGTLFFVFQVYFDFSAYSDMALGSSLMFGIRLPVNFNSPYKAASILEFWRRWHITLQKFIVDYLYTPMAMAMARRAAGLGRAPAFLVSAVVPLLLTFMLIGLWHGAGWNFVLFGLMHGIFLSINEAWRHFRKKKKAPPTRAARITGVALTMACIIVSYVMFRAGTLDAASNIYVAMAGGTRAASLVTFGPMAAGALVLLCAIVWFTPNSMEITWKYRPALKTGAGTVAVREIARWAWTPSRRSAIGFGALFIAAMLALSNLSPFIYFQF